MQQNRIKSWYTSAKFLNLSKIAKEGGFIQNPYSKLKTFKVLMEEQNFRTLIKSINNGSHFKKTIKQNHVTRTQVLLFKSYQRLNLKNLKRFLILLIKFRKSQRRIWKIKDKLSQDFTLSLMMNFFLFFQTQLNFKLSKSIYKKYSNPFIELSKCLANLKVLRLILFLQKERNSSQNKSLDGIKENQLKRI